MKNLAPPIFDSQGLYQTSPFEEYREMGRLVEEKDLKFNYDPFGLPPIEQEKPMVMDLC